MRYQKLSPRLNDARITLVIQTCSTSLLSDSGFSSNNITHGPLQPEYKVRNRVEKRETARMLVDIKGAHLELFLGGGNNLHAALVMRRGQKIPNAKGA